MAFLIRNTTVSELIKLFNAREAELADTHKNYLYSFKRFQKSHWFSPAKAAAPRDPESLMAKASKTQRASLLSRIKNYRHNKPQIYIALALKKLFDNFPTEKGPAVLEWRRKVYLVYGKLINSILTDNNTHPAAPLSLAKAKDVLTLLINNRVKFQTKDTDFTEETKSNNLNFRHDDMILQIALQALQDLATHEAMEIKNLLEKRGIFNVDVNNFMKHQLWLKSQGIIRSEFNITNSLAPADITPTILKVCAFIEASPESENFGLPKLDQDQLADYYATAAKHIVAYTENDDFETKKAKAIDLYSRFMASTNDISTPINLENLSTRDKLDRIIEIVELSTSTTTVNQELKKLYDTMKRDSDDESLVKIADAHEKFLRGRLSDLSKQVGDIYLSLAHDPKAQRQAFYLLNNTHGTSLNTLIASKPGSGLDPLLTEVYLDYAERFNPSELHKYREIMLYRYHTPRDIKSGREVTKDEMNHFKAGWQVIADGYRQGRFGFEQDTELAELYQNLKHTFEDKDIQAQSDAMLALAKSYIENNEPLTAIQLLNWSLNLENESTAANLLEASRLLAKLTCDAPNKDSGMNYNTLEGVNYAHAHYIRVLENMEHISTKYAHDPRTALIKQRKYVVQAQEYLLKAVYNHQQSSDDKVECQFILNFFKRLHHLPYQDDVFSIQEIHELDGAFNGILGDNKYKFHDVWLMSEGLAVADDMVLNDEMRHALGIRRLTGNELHESISNLEKENSRLAEQTRRLTYGCNKLNYHSHSNNQRIAQVLLGIGLISLAAVSTYIAIQAAPALLIAYPMLKIATFCLSGVLTTLGLLNVKNAIQANKWTIQSNNYGDKLFRDFICELGFDPKFGCMNVGSPKTFFSKPNEPTYDVAYDVTDQTYLERHIPAVS